jgi:hypothetical protein
MADKRECVREFGWSRDQFEISQRFFIEIRQTDVAQKEFHVSAVTIDRSREEVPINPIIRPELIIISHANPLHVAIIFTVSTV